MSHKRRYFAISAPKRDAFVDAPREVGYAVFEVMVCDLHDILKVGKLNTCEIEGGKRDIPDSCWIIATSGDSPISLAASLKQSFTTAGQP